ncbi:MAG: choice-of-anchor I family protein [Culicoidibacterales bacterium]
MTNKTKIILATIATTSLFGHSLMIAAQEIVQEFPLKVNKISGYDTGIINADGGVAEIVQFNPDNNKFYLINGTTKTIEIVDMSQIGDGINQPLLKEKDIHLAELVNDETFTFGDVTSIDINTQAKVMVIAIQAEDYKQSGKVAVLDYDGNLLETFTVGVQPDMVKMTDDGMYILTADEGEPRLGIDGDDWDPEGSVTIINYQTKQTQIITFDDENVIDNDVHIRNVTGGAKMDLEPEYIALSADGLTAYVSLQENNAIATIDIPTGSVERVQSLGVKDHSIAGNGLDAARDGEILIETLPIKGVYMPDAITSVVINGKEYLLTANEGDATEWGKKEAAFTNVSSFKKYFADKELEVTDETFAGMSAEEAKLKLVAMKEAGKYDKLEVLTDMGDDAIYVLGGRSFAIWDADTMELVYDSGSQFEAITAELLPEGFNWSNDDTELDKRSSKKGPEPEGIEIGIVNDKIYAFIGLERIGGIMTYDITNPTDASIANYINTRDFSGAIAGDVSPEGIEFVSATNSPTNKPLVLVGNEVSGTVSILELEVETTDITEQPAIPGFGPNGDVIPELDPEESEQPATPGFGPDGDVTPEVDYEVSTENKPATPGFGPNGDSTPQLTERPNFEDETAQTLPQTGSFTRELLSIGAVITGLGGILFGKLKRDKIR